MSPAKRSIFRFLLQCFSSKSSYCDFSHFPGISIQLKRIIAYRMVEDSYISAKISPNSILSPAKALDSMVSSSPRLFKLSISLSGEKEYCKILLLSISTTQYSKTPLFMYRFSFITISLPLVDGDNTSTISEGMPSYLLALLILSRSQMTTTSGWTTLGSSSNLVAKPKSLTSKGEVNERQDFPLK